MMKMNCNIKVFLFMLFMANGVTMLHAQYRFDNILYGAAYYHEYMPSAVSYTHLTLPTT